jgi:hypothetical protein
VEAGKGISETADTSGMPVVDNVQPMAIPPNRWGEDHWALLSYVVSCFDGSLDLERLRCNGNTRLKGPSDRVIGHDDWDCLQDLEAAGLVEIISRLAGIVHLTEKGNAVAFRLREHKWNGQTFATFEADPFSGPAGILDADRPKASIYVLGAAARSSH